MKARGVYTLGPKCLAPPACHDDFREGFKVEQHKPNKMFPQTTQAKPYEGQGGLYIGP